ncbi:MAG: hypothetical protein KGJ62_13740 [Armatimonadetes bacterium]|nr:hypothetical protein [Armatimonadota bacterium]MDE2207629.1 hypothetical protein [Armatimonadota bacterium]
MTLVAGLAYQGVWLLLTNAERKQVVVLPTPPDIGDGGAADHALSRADHHSRNAVSRLPGGMHSTAMRLLQPCRARWIEVAWLD